MTDISNAGSLGEVHLALRRSLSPKYGDREAATMARMIMMSLKKWDLPHLLANEDREASSYVKARAQEILSDLLKDMPIQYALGEASFYGLTLKVAPGVLIPRPETEELVDIIVHDNKESDLKVLDLCTGSGAIALALARNLPFSDVTAIDVSPIAVEITRENAENLKISLHVLQEDIFKFVPTETRYDIIVSNPPYIAASESRDMEPNVLNYEPHSALFVPDDDPLLFYRRIAEIALTSLSPRGKLYLEINPLFKDELKALLEGKGFDNIDFIKDFRGKVRFVKASTTL